MTDELEEFLPYRKEGEETDKSNFIDKTARVIGSVDMGLKISLWPGALIKGDESEVKIDDETTIMSNSSIQGTENHKTEIGKKSLISSGAQLKGCRIGEGVLVGIDAVVLEGAEIGDNSIIGTNAIIPKGMKIPEKSVVMGQPAEIKRDVSDEDLQKVEQIRTDLFRKRDEFKIMMKRGEEFNVYDTPKRPEEILKEHEELPDEQFDDIMDLEKTKKEMDKDLFY